MKFDFNISRSERAKQVDALVPALANKETRWMLLDKLGKDITRDESDSATVMHFVWVLRDTFNFERNQAMQSKKWQELCGRWADILGLTDWAKNIDLWRHPDGEFKSDANFIVHPCNREIGWTSIGIQKRIDKFGIKGIAKAEFAGLIAARKVMNTECDCFIQTPKRLIVIECKDKTDFIAEQTQRQERLFECLKRLLPKEKDLIYLEVADEKALKPESLGWSWQEIDAYLRKRYGE